MIKLIKMLIEKVFMYAKRICAVSMRQLIAVGVAAVVLSSTLTGFDALKDSHYRSIDVSLNYDGAQYGLTPSQGRFDINKIKSDEVIEAAIKKTGDDSLTVENVKPRITIDAKMPKSAVDKTISAISEGGSYSYTPAEFVIYYSQKKKYGKNYTIDFLNALAESYKEFFARTYSDKNVVLEFNESNKYATADYDEICDILTDKVNSMINYLGEKQEAGVDFVSSDTGYKYSDIITSLVNIRDINIEKLSAYIQQNRVSKDKSMFLNKKRYLIDSELRNYDYLKGASDISNASLSIYDARISGVAFVPTLDDENEFYMSRTKTGIDNLSKLSYQNGKKATDVKKTVDDYQDKYNNFEQAPESTEEMHETAASLIADIEENLDSISDLAIRTDNEYIAKKNNNYITVTSPAEYRISIVPWVKRIIVFSIIMIAAIRILGVIKRIILKRCKKESGENESEAV